MIIALEEAKLELNNFREQIVELGNALRIDSLREQAQTLEEKSQSPDFWNDQDKSTKSLQTLKQLKDKIERYENLCTKLDDTITMAELAIEENDESLTEEILSDVAAIKAEEEKQRIEILLSGPYDKNNAILSFHPGAGGTEAQDWAQMLYRMYMRWGEAHGYNVKLVDWLEGDEAGIKSATLIIEGMNAYGFLKSEHGVHRLVRVSPFDSSGRRHTSFSSVEVMPEFNDDDNSITLRDEDLEITAHRSSGAGGQHINKTDSAIRIVHIPTGIVVGCQTERSQLQNKETALKMLKSKLMEIKEREHLERIEDIKGEQKLIEWGSQIRSYVFMPYTLVKDNRTDYESGNIGAVMDGDLDGFINAYLSAAATGKLKLK